jgi:putative PIG3 family NAD(P)H quinone oxidoreductase
MQGISVQNQGPDYALKLQELDPPKPGPDHVLIDIHTTAVNRADLLQAQGLYPPPQGASAVLGLECAGTRSDTGEKVMCLLPGGGYASQAIVHQGSVLPIPASYSMEEAGATMETALTAYLNIFILGKALPGNRVLIHGGSSGVGTMAIQLCKVAGIQTVVTAGSDEKCKRCETLGAQQAINYKTKNFEEELEASSFDLILDCIGAPYLKSNIALLKLDGRLVLIGLMGGAKTDIHLGHLLAKRIQIIGSTLRSLSAQRKQDIITAFQTQFGEAMDTRAICPVIHQVFPLQQAQAAHQLVRSSQHIGKVVLTLLTH